MQLRWVFTRDPEGSALVTDEQLDMDNVKDVTWMTAYTTECNVLHDVVYCLLSSLWSNFTDACSVSTHTAFTQLLCSQQLWEALLTAFPSSEYRSVFFDDDDRYITIGYVPPGIKESKCDDATIVSLMVL